MRRLIKNFFADQTGATAIEYALIACGISIVIVTAVQGIGTAMNTKYGSVSTALKERSRGLGRYRLRGSAFSARSMPMRANITQPPPVSAALISCSIATCQRGSACASSGNCMM